MRSRDSLSSVRSDTSTNSRRRLLPGANFHNNSSVEDCPSPSHYSRNRRAHTVDDYAPHHTSKSKAPQSIEEDISFSSATTDISLSVNYLPSAGLGLEKERISMMSPTYQSQVAEYTLLDPMNLVCLKGMGDGTSSNGYSSLPTLWYGFTGTFRLYHFSNYTAHSLLSCRSPRLSVNVVRRLAKGVCHTYRERTLSQTCYARSILPGCKGP